MLEDILRTIAEEIARHAREIAYLVESDGTVVLRREGGIDRVSFADLAGRCPKTVASTEHRCRPREALGDRVSESLLASKTIAWDDESRHITESPITS